MALLRRPRLRPRLRPVALLVAGDPIPEVSSRYGGFAELVRRAAPASFAGEFRDVELRDGTPLPPPEDLAGAIVTGSASSVTERTPWMLRGEAYLRQLVGAAVPVFGICFGHQLLGQALGGEVARNPRGREIGTVDLELVGEDPLLPGGASLRANATHVDTVGVLPVGARVFARSARDPHAGVRFGEWTWGVQFHPEMDADVVRRYVRARAEAIRGEGGDPDALLADVDEGHAGRSTLAAFLELVRAKEA